LGQGSLGLQEAAFYNDTTGLPAAYKQFINDLATALTNNTVNVSRDVEEIYTLEKQIAAVKSRRSHTSRIHSIVLVLLGRH
jgi:hypothetical protein